MCHNKTMKRLATSSQNFLRSPRLVESLVSRSNLTPNDTVYDLGAGSGVISSVLAKHVARVVAVEYDERLMETLHHNLEKYPNVTIRQANIVTMPLPRTPYKVFANIPFHLSSQIVQRFINSPTSPEAAYLIVQRQFGRKLIATDTTHFTSQLGMIIGAEYKARIIKSHNRTDFWPHPAVDTVCLELVKRKQSLVPKTRLRAYKQFTTDCFNDPKVLSKMPLEVIGQKSGASPSRLSLDQWTILFEHQRHY